MTVRYQTREGTLHVYLEGELGHHEAIRLMGRLSALVEDHLPTRTELDLSGLEFMDSSGIGLILGRCDTAVALMINVRIINVSKPIMRLIRLSGIDRVSNLTVEPKLENEHPRPVDLDGKDDGDYGFNEELYII